jgi:hypothetical protein
LRLYYPFPPSLPPSLSPSFLTKWTSTGATGRRFINCRVSAKVKKEEEEEEDEDEEAAEGGREEGREAMNSCKAARKDCGEVEGRDRETPKSEK